MKPPASLAPLLFAIGVSCLAATGPIFDFDLYWHLAFGREIWNTGTIIQQDVFSFTAAGTSFTNRYWLAQWLFYGLQHHLGWNALPILKLLFVAGIAAMMFQTALFMRAKPWVTGLIVPMCILLIHYRFTERPELFTLLFMASLPCLLAGWRNGTLDARRLWAIPPLMLLWDWLHGGIFGLVYLTAIVVMENVLAKTGKRAPECPPTRDLNLVWGVSLVAMTLNPFGLMTYGEFFGHLSGIGSSRPAETTVVEYLPLSWGEFKIPIIVLALWVLLSLVHRKSVAWPVMIATLMFVLLATQITRVIGIAMILVGPLLASCISVLLTHPGWGKRIGKVLAGCAALVLIVEGYVEKFRPPPTPRSFGWGVADHALPVGAARLVRDLNLRGNFFNSGHFGGYLAWELYPGRRVFHYNNGNIFGDTYRYWGEPELLLPHDLQFAIIGHREDLDNFPQHLWAHIFRELAGALVIKRTPENAELIRQLEFRVFHPRLTPLQMDQLAEPDRLQLLEEMAVYLAYRTDPAMATRYAMLLASRPGVASKLTKLEYLKKAASRHPELIKFLPNP